MPLGAARLCGGQAQDAHTGRNTHTTSPDEALSQEMPESWASSNSSSFSKSSSVLRALGSFLSPHRRTVRPHASMDEDLPPSAASTSVSSFGSRLLGFLGTRRQEDEGVRKAQLLLESETDLAQIPSLQAQVLPGNRHRSSTGGDAASSSNSQRVSISGSRGSDGCSRTSNRSSRYSFGSSGSSYFRSSSRESDLSCQQSFTSSDRSSYSSGGSFSTSSDSSCYSSSFNGAGMGLASGDGSAFQLQQASFQDRNIFQDRNVQRLEPLIEEDETLLCMRSSSLSRLSLPHDGSDAAPDPGLVLTWSSEEVPDADPLGPAMQRVSQADPWPGVEQAAGGAPLLQQRSPACQVLLMRCLHHISPTRFVSGLSASASGILGGGSGSGHSWAAHSSVALARTRSRLAVSSTSPHGLHALREEQEEEEEAEANGEEEEEAGAGCLRVRGGRGCWQDEAEAEAQQQEEEAEGEEEDAEEAQEPRAHQGSANRIHSFLQKLGGGRSSLSGERGRRPRRLLMERAGGHLPAKDIDAEEMGEQAEEGTTWVSRKPLAVSLALGDQLESEVNGVGNGQDEHDEGRHGEVGRIGCPRSPPVAGALSPDSPHNWLSILLDSGSAECEEGGGPAGCDAEIAPAGTACLSGSAAALAALTCSRGSEGLADVLQACSDYVTTEMDDEMEWL